jgi:hypothetical protein
MRSVRHIEDYPAGRPLAADDLVEFHAARLLLVVHLCGRRNKVRGLTKLAKLDFFVRYPAFFNRAAADLGQRTESRVPTVESAMVRHHYGPWDRRYYHILAVLEGKGLLSVTRSGPRTYEFALTADGTSAAIQLTQDEAFAPLVELARQVGTVFGGVTGSALKGYIYRAFDREVAQRRLGETIRP